MTASSPPVLLGLDTSTEACSVAISREGAVVASRWEPRERGHAERLVPMVIEVMGEAGIGFAALDALAVTVGPGSFTGVRVALAAARGFALAAECPLIGISTLEALAAAVPPHERADRAVLSVLTALPGQVFAQSFDSRLCAISPPAACELAGAAGLVGGRPAVIVGTGASAVLASMGERHCALIRSAAPELPNAAVLVERVAARIEAEGIAALAEVPAAPLYLKAPGLGPASPSVSASP